MTDPILPEDPEEPKDSIQKTMEVIEQLALEKGGSPLAAMLLPLAKAQLPNDPETLDEQLAKYAQLLLLMRSDGAERFQIHPNPFTTRGDPDEHPQPTLSQG